MAGRIVTFSSPETQDITITFKLLDNYYGETDPESLENLITESVMSALSGPDFDNGEDYEVIESLSDTLVAGQEYKIVMRVQERILGTGEYYPGNYYGPWEDSYPDDFEPTSYDAGFATDCDISVVVTDLAGSAVNLSTIKVDIGDPTDDGDIEFEDDYDEPDDYGDY